LPKLPQPHCREGALLLCEGEGDKALLDRLIQYRRLPNFDVRVAGGKGGFARKLIAVAGEAGFEDLLGILVVADADDDPRKSFEDVRQNIAGARAFWAASGQAGPAVQLGALSDGVPTVATILVPGGEERGCLETLCVRAARAVRPAIGRCVDPFLRCIEADGLSASAMAKAELRAIMLAEVPSEANASVSRLWSVQPDLVPIGSPVFDEIAAALQLFNEDATSHVRSRRAATM
jgi:hypothetical protein